MPFSTSIKYSTNPLTAVFFALAVMVQLTASMTVVGQGKEILSRRSSIVIGGEQQSIPVSADLRKLTAPVRSIANVVLGGQAIRTRTVFGSIMVQVRPQDEIWLVSARSENGCLACDRLVDGEWEPSDVKHLTAAHETEKEKSTVVYVHGNQTNDEYGRARGLQLYQNLFNRNVCETAPSVRFVIFTWRSEREKARMSSDFKVKLERSICVGSKFRCFLSQFESRNMLLIGFSLGGQVILSGLKEEQEQASDSTDLKTGKYSVALITPALDPSIESTCLNAVDENETVVRTIAFLNRKDPAIKASKVLTQSRRSHVCDQSGDEITFSRLAQWCPGELFGTVRVEDISSEVRSCHSITKYSDQSATIRHDIAQLIDLIRPTATFSDKPVSAEFITPATTLPSLSSPTLELTAPEATAGVN